MGGQVFTKIDRSSLGKGNEITEGRKRLVPTDGQKFSVTNLELKQSLKELYQLLLVSLLQAKRHACITGNLTIMVRLVYKCTKTLSKWLAKDDKNINAWQL